ncbi:hypothetical protein EJB05_45657, partial [Eragrostis curvula]
MSRPLYPHPTDLARLPPTPSLRSSLCARPLARVGAPLFHRGHEDAFWIEFDDEYRSSRTHQVRGCYCEGAVVVKAAVLSASGNHADNNEFMSSFESPSVDCRLPLP